MNNFHFYTGKNRYGHGKTICLILIYLIPREVKWDEFIFDKKIKSLVTCFSMTISFSFLSCVEMKTFQKHKADFLFVKY